MNTKNIHQIVSTSSIVLLRQMLAASAKHMIVENRLTQRAEMVDSLAKQNNLPVPMLGVAPLFDKVRLVVNTHPMWAVFNLGCDPLYQTGRLPMPGRDLYRLRRLYRAGVQFDALYLAHELPSDFRPGQEPLDLSLFTPAPPVGAVRLAKDLGRTANGMMAPFLALIGKSFAGVAAAGKGVANILRDPVLLGAVIPSDENPEPGIPAIWFLLAIWSW